MDCGALVYGKPIMYSLQYSRILTYAIESRLTCAILALGARTRAPVEESRRKPSVVHNASGLPSSFDARGNKSGSMAAVVLAAIGRRHRGRFVGTLLEPTFLEMRYLRISPEGFPITLLLAKKNAD